MMFSAHTERIKLTLTKKAGAIGRKGNKDAKLFEYQIKQ